MPNEDRQNGEWRREEKASKTKDLHYKRGRSWILERCSVIGRVDGYKTVIGNQ